MFLSTTTEHFNTKHGHASRSGHSLTYDAWASMRARVKTRQGHIRKYYAERGIGICDRWDSFESFLSDMGERPSREMTLERKDNSKGYSPENCVWATRKDQANNTRRNLRISFNGKTQNLCEWARELGILSDTIAYRIKRGYAVDEALSKKEFRGRWRDVCS